MNTRGETKPRVIFLTGGSRSGKSSRALELACSVGDRKKVFIATAEVTDPEMGQRIDRHKSERDSSWHTIEEPCDLAGALERVPEGAGVAVIDCLTVWLGNLMHYRGSEHAEHEQYQEVSDFLAAIGKPADLRCPLIIVGNELGMGLVPEHPLGRRFRDVAGRLNQAVAAAAHHAEFLVSGLPLVLKTDASGPSISND